MKILFDIVHPAGVHVFKHAIWELQNKGHEAIVTLRDKDNAGLLLQKYGINYIKTNSKTATTLLSSLIELIKRMFLLSKIIKKEKPNILVSKTGVNIAPLGFLFGIPVLEFRDTQIAYLNHLISFPFDTAIITPECFKIKFPLWKKKQLTYPGCDELAYLNKKYFSPDKTIKDRLKINKNRKLVLVRLVTLKAHHDAFLKGITFDQIDRLIEKLKNTANIYISSEYELPDRYKKFEIPVSLEKFLDFLSICDLYIGESATVASEACMLGIPAIYVCDSPRCYTTQLEEKYGVCKNFGLKEMDKAIEMGKNILEGKTRLKSYEFRFDLTAYMLELIGKYAKCCG